jgi:hypothetical protein
MIKVLDLDEMKLTFPKMKVMKEKSLSKEQLEIVFNYIEEDRKYNFITLITSPSPLFVIRAIIK